VYHSEEDGSDTSAIKIFNIYFIVFIRVSKMAESFSGDYKSNSSDLDPESDVWTFLTVVNKGITFEYVVPSFPVIHTNLTEVRLQWVNCEEDIEVFDSCTHDCASYTISRCVFVDKFLIHF